MVRMRSRAEGPSLIGKRAATDSINRGWLTISPDVDYDSLLLRNGWSPVWFLAGASDLVSGSKIYLRALVAELQDAVVLAADADVASFEELMSAVEGTSGVLADTVEVPLLNVPSVHEGNAGARD